MMCLSLIIVFTSCTNRNFEKIHPIGPNPPHVTCDTATAMSYSQHIAPIISNKCVVCHSASSPGGGYNLSAYSGLSVAVNNGKLLGSIVWDGSASNMPQGSASRLPNCDISKIRNWINAGAPNN